MEAARAVVGWGVSPRGCTRSLWQLMLGRTQSHDEVPVTVCFVREGAWYAATANELVGF